MTAACYSVEKNSIGWVIRAGHEAVLTCKEKRIAIDTAIHAGRLLQGEIPACDIEPFMDPEHRGACHAVAVRTASFRAAASGATCLPMVQ
jgi:hypothetical protein